MSELSPNAREHWRAKATVVKSARLMAYALCAENCVKTRADDDEELRIVLTFHPPNKRHFDLDGLITRCKAYQDGVFDYLHLNDNLIVSLEARRGEVVKGGEVVITIVGDDDGF
jgi:hypothetical protein